MRFRILDSIPMSGSVREVHFDARGDCTWVEFEEDERQWVGVFGRGPIPNTNLVAQFSGTTNAFVVAGGQGYIVDVTNETCTLKSHNVYLQGLITVPNRDLVVAYDNTQLEVFDSQKLLWRSERIALDGIRLDRVDETLLYGHIWEYDGWYSFDFHIDHLIFNKSLFVSAEWNHFD